MDNEKIIRLEEEFKHIEDKINKMEIKVENIYELTASVREIALEVKAMREDLNKIDARVKTIEEKPAKRYDSIVGQVISIIVAGVVGFFLAKVGIK